MSSKVVGFQHPQRDSAFRRLVGQSQHGDITAVVGGHRNAEAHRRCCPRAAGKQREVDGIGKGRGQRLVVREARNGGDDMRAGEQESTGNQERGPELAVERAMADRRGQSCMRPASAALECGLEFRSGVRRSIAGGS
ncbi:hypothetical protein [Streptomyces sp. NPDC058728]|uniref:hypothetical protein n=1 Tax=Streptomyces sp. NPDC058728 TaxID=3346612 RepID=UPI0036B24788